MSVSPAELPFHKDKIRYVWFTMVSSMYSKCFLKEKHEREGAAK